MNNISKNNTISKDEVIKKADNAFEKKHYLEAVRILQDYNSKYSDDAEIHMRLGNILLYSQSQEKALEHLSKAVALDPSNSTAWRTLIGFYLRHNNINRAIEIGKRAIDAVSDSEITQQFIELCIEEGRIKEALEIAEKLYERNPNDLQTLRTAARILYKRKPPQEVLGIYQHIILNNKELMQEKDWAIWSELMIATNHLKEACNYLHKYSVEMPKEVNIKKIYIKLLIECEMYDKALKIAESTLQLDTANIQILLQIAHIYRIVGNNNKSDEYIRKALNEDPYNIAILSSYISRAKVTYGDDRFKRINRAAAHMAKFTENERIIMHFTLGKTFDDVNDYGTAFEHYRLGGALVLKNKQNEAHLMKHTLTYFQKEFQKRWLHTPKNERSLSDKPIFIVGMPRSGTTLLEQVLSSLEGVYGAGELPYFGTAMHRLPFEGGTIKTVSFEPFGEKENISIAERAEYYLEQAERHVPKNAARIIDKMPGNAIWSGMQHVLFPNGHIIYARRHPVEICLSAYRILFKEGHNWSYDLKQAGIYMKQLWETMEFWKSTLPEGTILEVFYENMVEDLEKESKRIANYIRMPWSEKCLDFHKNETAIKTASIDQVRKPIYKSSINRWKKYEPYLQPLLEELGDIIEQYEDQLAASRQKTR